MKLQKITDIPKSPVDHEGASLVQIQWLISKKDGAENFAMRLFEVEPGGYTPLHSHIHEHQVYILSGSGILVFEGTEQSFNADYVIFIPPNKEHRFKNTGDSTLKFLCLIPAFAV